MESMKHCSKRKALKPYSEHCYHTSVAVFFPYREKVYGISLPSIPASWCYWSKSSKEKGGQWALRLSIPRNAKKTLAKRAGCVCLGNYTEVFNSDESLNKGEQIEKILYEAMTGKTWEKDFTPWYKGADIETAGAKIQVKYQGATIITMAQVKRFEK